MKSFLCFLAAAFAFPFALAQIDLPDYFVDEEDAFSDENFVPDPERGEGLHARPDEARSGEEEDWAVDVLDDPDTRRMIQRMNMPNMQGHQQLINRPNQADSAEDRERMDRLLAGPEWVVADSRLEDGEARKFELPNQTLLLETSAGNIPLRLHELVSMKRVEGAVYQLELMDGDLISGKMVKLPVVKVDDTLRRLEPDEVRAITLSRE